MVLDIYNHYLYDLTSEGGMMSHLGAKEEMVMCKWKTLTGFMEASGLISMAMILALSVGVAGAATITVANTNDAGAGSLREAIASAASGDTVSFAAGVTGTIVLTSGELGIDKDLTISGTGASKLAVDGNANSRVFVVYSSKTVNLSGLTVRNGKVSAGNGGGIHNSGTLTLSGVEVSDNAVIDYDGGGIFNNQGAVLTISDSVITGNTANDHNSGGIYNAGTLTMTNSTISGNAAKYYGGGISNGGTATLVHVTIIGNQSDYAGGGISNFGTITLTDSMIDGNIALTSYGGGIGNEANATLNLSNVIIRNNSSEYYGGGIYGAGTMTLSRVAITDNTSANACGGIGCSTDTLIMEDSIVARNVAPNGAGAGICTVYGGTLSASNVTISENTASFPGGGVYNCMICTTTLTNVTISGNQTTQSVGGGIYNDGGGILSLTNVTVAHNTDAGTGGGIFHSSSSSDLTLRNVIVADNAPTNCNSALTYTGGNNLSSDTTCGFSGPGDLSSTDPLLGLLTNNGGFTETHALQYGSPAINAADAAHAPAADQRGVPRPYGTAPDMGAYEYTPVNPVEGAYGTKIAITGSGYGAKKGKVTIGPASLKISEWADGLIRCSLSKALSPGSYDVTIRPKGTAATTVTNGFSSMGPEIVMPGHNHGSIGSEVTIPGNFFGTKKGKVTLGGKSCKVTSWTMDADRGQGEIKIIIPKGLPPGSHELKVIINGVGTDTIDFTVD